MGKLIGLPHAKIGHHDLLAWLSALAHFTLNATNQILAKYLPPWLLIEHIFLGVILPRHIQKTSHLYSSTLDKLFKFLSRINDHDYNYDYVVANSGRRQAEVGY